MMLWRQLWGFYTEDVPRKEWAVKLPLGSWAMCDTERDWEWVKKRWRLASVRQDPGDLEDLQMTLSLADDAGEELMEDVMLK